MPGPGHLWDTDLLVLDGHRFASNNSGHKYIVLTIDVFSRFCRAEAIKNKGSKEMVRAFEAIFDRTEKLPRFCRSDRGTEYSNRELQALFKEKNVKHYFTNTDTKANYSERLVKTIKRRLFQFFQRNNSYSYENELQDIIRSYNRTYHQSIGRAPEEVTSEDTQQVWDYQYVQHSPNYRRSLKEALKGSSNAKSHSNFKYNIGQTVRVAYFKRKPFDRSYDELFSGEIFTIRKRAVIENIPVYRLTDCHGDDVKGEITPVRFDPNALFKIEKVIKKRVVDGVNQSYVQYQSWPKSYNEWIPTSSIVGLKKKKKKKKK